MVKYKVFTVARTKEVGKGGDQRREQECIRHPDHNKFHYVLMK